MSNGKHIIQNAVRQRPLKPERSHKYVSLVEVIQELIEQEFTGHLKINFSQGGIGRIEKFEEILRGGLQAD
jgi:hypothetical protein